MAGRLLIVEDDETTRVAMVDLLTGAGYETIGVGSFEEARQALLALRPDLLITDIRLREYNGLQLLVGAPEPVRTVVVTGFPDPVLKAEAHAHGAAWLIKPIVPGDLLATIRDMLARPAPRPTRRWERKRVTNPVSADVNGTAVRIVEVSYGGVRVDLERDPAHAIPRSFTMAVADVAIPVDLVWHNPTGERGWSCGLAVAHMNDVAASTWFGFVDAIA